MLLHIDVTTQARRSQSGGAEGAQDPSNWNATYD